MCVIQIWFIASRHHQGLQPHYQQISREDLPARRGDSATTYSLIGDDSPMEHHITARLTATTVKTDSELCGDASYHLDCVLVLDFANTP